MHNMKISVCIPTYKRPTMLVKALDSVLAQSVSAYEIIVGDDSPDGATEATARELLVQNPEAPIRYFHHSPGFGQAANVAKLFELATGESSPYCMTMIAFALKRLKRCWNLWRNIPKWSPATVAK